MDPEFLAALPEELRLEIIAENRQRCLANRGGIMAATLNKRQPSEPAPVGQKKLELPTREPRPTFTIRGIWKENELRSTVQLWYAEFKNEGPHSEDVQALERYLRRVVVDERDLSKARGMVKWLAWLVEEDDTTGHGQDLWRNALESIKVSVQGAVQERGLGALDL
jgi:DNA repair protein REV1